MSLSQSLQQKLLQKLSPQQIQLMKLLQVPTANLEERIKEELEENPALEATEDDHDDGTMEDAGWLKLNPWGFEYDNYCSIPELSRMMKAEGLTVQKTWGVTCGAPWFLNDFFVGKILERLTPFFLKMILSFDLFLDQTLARLFPLKYFTDKVIVVATKLK